MRAGPGVTGMWTSHSTKASAVLRHPGSGPTRRLSLILGTRQVADENRLEDEDHR